MNGASATEKCHPEKNTKNAQFHTDTLRDTTQDMVDTSRKKGTVVITDLTRIITDQTMITITTVKANGQNNPTAVIETILGIIMNMTIAGVVVVIIGKKIKIEIGGEAIKNLTENHITIDTKNPEEEGLEETGLEETDIKARVDTKIREEEQTDIIKVGIITISVIIVVETGMINVGIIGIKGIKGIKGIIGIKGHRGHLGRTNKGRLKDLRLTMTIRSGILDGKEWKWGKKPKRWRKEESISLMRKGNVKPR